MPRFRIYFRTDNIGYLEAASAEEAVHRFLADGPDICDDVRPLEFDADGHTGIEVINDDDEIVLSYDFATRTLVPGEL